MEPKPKNVKKKRRKWRQIRGCNNSQPSNDHCWYSSHQCTCENHQEGPSCESSLWPKSKTSFAQSHLQVTSLCPMSPHLCQHHHLHRIRKFKTKQKKQAPILLKITQRKHFEAYSSTQYLWLEMCAKCESFRKWERWRWKRREKEAIFLIERLTFWFWVLGWTEWNPRRPNVHNREPRVQLSAVFCVSTFNQCERNTETD